MYSKHLDMTSHKTLNVSATPLSYYRERFSMCSWLLFSLVFTDKQLMCHVVVIFTKLHYRLRSISIVRHILHHRNTAIWVPAFHFDKLAVFYQKHLETEWNRHMFSSSLYIFARLNNLEKVWWSKLEHEPIQSGFYLFFLQGNCMTFSSSNWFTERLTAALRLGSKIS